MQAGLRAWTQVLLGQADDKAEVDMDTDAPQVSHKPGGEPKIKVSGWCFCWGCGGGFCQFCHVFWFACHGFCQLHNAVIIYEPFVGDKYFFLHLALEEYMPSAIEVLFAFQKYATS